MNALGGDSFDTWLGEQLQHHVSVSEGPSPAPVQAKYHAAHVATGHMSFFAKVAALLTTKAAIGVAASVLVASAAGSEAIISGSVNPTDWGQQVVNQVNKCKDALAPGSHGIGKCVSSFASQHGKQVSSEHRANPTSGQGHADRTPGPPAVKVHPTQPPHPTPHAHPTPPNQNKNT